MATPTRPSAKEPEHSITVLAMKYDGLIESSKRQAARAREMSDSARKMIDRAIEMRKGPLRFVMP